MGSCLFRSNQLIDPPTHTHTRLAMLLLRHQPQRQLALQAGDGGRGSSLPALASRLQQRRAGADATAGA